jgi:AhpC/TSA family/Thiol:disulfide interchange protein DsbD, N-terminal
VNVAVFAVIPDAQEALAAFASEHGITYPLLSDAGSEVIRRYGILNTLIRPDEAIYGIPYPGSYITDERGVVVEKIFHQRYQVRDDAESLLHTRFGAALHVEQDPSVTVDSPGVRVSAVLGAEEFVFQRRATLFVRLDLDPGLHVYGPPTPEGYVATSVAVTGPEGLIVEPPAYPPTRPIHFEALGETLHVFEGAVEVAVPLTANIRAGDRVPLEVAVEYQACDDRQCFLPQRKTLRLEVPLAPLNRPQPRA